MAHVKRFRVFFAPEVPKSIDWDTSSLTSVEAGTPKEAAIAALRKLSILELPTRIVACVIQADQIADGHKIMHAFELRLEPVRLSAKEDE